MQTDLADGLPFVQADRVEIQQVILNLMANAIEAMSNISEGTRVLLMSPQGRRFDQRLAEVYSREDHLILVAGHYEGVDQRVADHLVDDEVSIGDYVLTNGALAALVVTDAIVRLIPGVLGDKNSAAQDSFATGLLDYPHYTRPESFRDWKVPDVLLSGNHAAIEAWRRHRALEITKQRRPDLL